MSKADVNKKATALEPKLKGKLFLDGSKPGPEDVKAFNDLLGANNQNLYRWTKHMASFTEKEREAWTAPVKAPTAGGTVDAPAPAPKITTAGGSTANVAGAGASAGAVIGKCRAGSGEFRVQVVPYSVLGTQLPVANMKTFVTVNNAPGPDEKTCFLDAAGLHHVQGYAKKGPAGAAKAIYDHVGTILHPKTGLAHFPAEVQAAVNQECDAKFFSHVNNTKGQTFHVIHAVGPDFVPDRWPKNKPFPEPKPAEVQEAAKLLGVVYANTLREYAGTSLPALRLLPLSSGIFAGGFINHMPQLTRLGLEMGFNALTDAEQAALCAGGRQIDMCIFLESELKAYTAAFQ